MAIRKVKQIVEEPIFAIPHLVMVLPNSIHSIGDPDEMLEETERNVLIHRVVLGQYERDLQHVLAVESHPRRAICLIQVTACRELGTAIEYPDIVEAEKSAGEDILSLRIFSVDPPVKVQHQPLERAFQEAQIRPAQLL